VLDKIDINYYVLFINDGSEDETMDVLVHERSLSDKIRVINLSRNFGKEAALTAGLDHAEGDAVILMDVDLQDPPEIISKFIAKWREGFDVVYGVRKNREHDTFFKRASADLFYKIINRMSNKIIPKNVGDFRLMDIRVVNEIRKMREHNRFSKGILAYAGFKKTGIEYSRPKRCTGKTKWRAVALWGLAINGIISFSPTPLKVWSYIGFCVSLFSVIYILVLLLGVLVHGRDVPGYASIMVSILFLGGLQLISLGVIGEYISRIFDEVKNRPIYIIESIHE
jgi:glycosyltransferase involved in cell wall biosynthesis